MILKEVKSIDFRNLSFLEIGLHDGINVFYGNNAQGKTNFLEAVYLCATGRSWRTASDKEMIRFSCKEAHLQALVFHEGLEDRIDVHLKKDEKKSIAVNRLPIKRLGELYGRLLVVLFSPEDLSLVKNGPAERRKFMDVELCQLSPLYYFALKQYYHILRQRNNLLKSISSHPDLKKTLFVWDEQLVQQGFEIMKYRQTFIDKIQELAVQIHSDISSGSEKLSIQYRPNVTERDFLLRLKKNLDRDILAGATGCGIHKDDIYFGINDTDIRVYGSQGQQRTACLSCKLAEVHLIQIEKNHSPLLLLDDVLSELDEGRQKYLLTAIQNVQTCITATGVDDILNKTTVSGVIFQVENGNITFKNM